ncbi:hypothetical protein OAF85_00120 [Planctomycetota bacterium]|nr:hypothetical protein [Planctomycetota bacterium]
MTTCAPALLTMATMLLCTAWPTLQQDHAWQDRDRRLRDPVARSWKIQTGVSGSREERSEGQLVRSLSEESAPGAWQLLIDLSARLERLEAAD